LLYGIRSNFIGGLQLEPVLDLVNQETAARHADENDCSSMRVACATEPIVKKKIRAVQYGVGPIGAAIVRLMWEKESIEIIGAIDSDPAKAGQDLGDVVDGPDAPWGVPVTDDAAAMLGESADVVIHSTSSLLPM